MKIWVTVNVLGCSIVHSGSSNSFLCVMMRRGAKLLKKYVKWFSKVSFYSYFHSSRLRRNKTVGPIPDAGWVSASHIYMLMYADMNDVMYDGWTTGAWSDLVFLKPISLSLANA